jgi:hypothetical protein
MGVVPLAESLTTEWIAQRVHLEEYIISRHAEVERLNDVVSISELEEALLCGTVIEDYPDDLRGSSCLVWGKSAYRDIHVVCGRNRHDWLVIITVDLPTLPKWRSPSERNG